MKFLRYGPAVQAKPGVLLPDGPVGPCGYNSGSIRQEHLQNGMTN